MHVNKYINVGQWITKWAFLRPDKVALISEEGLYTYKHLNERVNRLANFLLNLGFKKGDTIGALTYNCVQFIEIYFAVSKIGCILVPLNFRLSENELKYIIQDSEAKGLFFGYEFSETIEKIRADLPVRKDSYICVGSPAPEWAKDYFRVLENSSTSEPNITHIVGGEDPHILMYTSGTTGTPKGALLSHRKTFFNVLNADIYYDLRHEDKLYVGRALFHSGGLLVEASPIFYKGGTVIISKRFVPEEILRTIQTHRVTVLETSATLFKFILERKLENFDLSSLRCCYTGGERVPTSLIEEYASRGIVISQIFGQTETSTITWLPQQDALRKLGSVGIPVFHAHVKIVNKEGRELPPGEVGEIIVSGPILMNGYWKRPDLTAKTIVDGWLHTGDLAIRDEEGFFYIVDRAKDMFISGGENVYPAEVEKVLLDNPKIQDVAVIGVPDEKWGERGVAFIVLKNGEAMNQEEIISFCKGRLAKYKIPKSIVFVTELPKTASGKIKKHKLREEYIQKHLNLDKQSG